MKFPPMPANVRDDMAVACACGAQEQEPCRGLAPQTSHIGRRIKRLLAYRNLHPRPDQREGGS